MISIFFVCTFQEQANCQVEPVVAQKRDYFVFGYRYRLQVREYLFPEKVFYELLVERLYIYEKKIIPALRKNHVVFYQSRNVEPFHQQFVKDFFREEIFPYLQPVVE